MKILIAHDPTADEPFVSDLQWAGYPERSDVLVVSIADVILPLAPEGESPAPPKLPPRVQAIVEQAREAAADMKTQLEGAFPHWTIGSEAVADAPAWGIVRKAQAWRPDVIVVGAYRRAALSRLVLGSVSQKVLHEAPGSVRIVKERTTLTADAPRVLIGVDGSQDAEAAVAALVSRAWPDGTAVYVVTVLDPNDAGTAAVGGEVEARARLDRIGWQLTNRGLRVSIDILHGDPKESLLAEAASWRADCIFVGARGLNVVERLLLGSVSSTLAARAPCSVEVVRSAH